MITALQGTQKLIKQPKHTTHDNVSNCKASVPTCKWKQFCGYEQEETLQHLVLHAENFRAMEETHVFEYLASIGQALKRLANQFPTLRVLFK